jgi:hypothetical protein
MGVAGAWLQSDEDSMVAVILLQEAGGLLHVIDFGMSLKFGFKLLELSKRLENADLEEAQRRTEPKENPGSRLKGLR